MGKQSTVVKRYSEYTIDHVDGSQTLVRETVFVDPGEPEVLHVFRDARLQQPVEFIPIEIHLAGGE